MSSTKGKRGRLCIGSKCGNGENGDSSDDHDDSSDERDDNSDDHDDGC
ncbi:hypothetical protein [Haladaptatus sp. W1]|nr:hypothetical protein [Haladaptatus sp. W1]